MNDDMNALKTDTLIVLLNWNGSSLTIDCCKSLLKLDDKSHDILVIDNHSAQSDFEPLQDFLINNSKFVSKQQPLTTHKNLFDTYEIESIVTYTFDNNVNIILVRSLTNHGFSRGCNFGALFAESLSYKYLMFLNNDTIVEPDFLSILKKFQSKYDIVIPQIRYFHPASVIWNCGGEINAFGRRKYFYANEEHSKAEVPVKPFTISFATGCCMFMETTFYIESGMFTEDYFFGEEDVDFALRLKKREAKIACIPHALIYHKVGASLAGDLTKLRRKAFIHYLNRFINMKKHLGLLWMFWILPAILKMVVNLRTIYKLPFLKILSFIWRIVFSSCKMNKVDKNYFESVMKNGY